MFCQHCGIEIISLPKGRKKKYCSENCRRSWWKENPEQSSKTVYTKICFTCGIDFTSFNEKAKYCSNGCSGKANKKTEHYRTTVEKTCPVCGINFYTINKKQITCSQSCGRKHGNEKLKKFYVCEYCGRKFSGENAFRKKFCGKICAANALFGTVEERAARKMAEYQSRLVAKECPFCGKDFETTLSYKRYCSGECAYQAILNQKREQWAEAYEPRAFSCKECDRVIITECGNKASIFCSIACQEKYGKQVYKKHRKEQMRFAYRTPVSFKKIYLRDKGVCKICEMPVLFDKSSHKWAATIDHIIPLSKGGTHEPSNCQLAHRLCNSVKLTEEEEFQIDWELKNIIDEGRWTEALLDYNEMLCNDKRAPVGAIRILKNYSLGERAAGDALEFAKLQGGGIKA